MEHGKPISVIGQVFRSDGNSRPRSHSNMSRPGVVVLEADGDASANVEEMVGTDRAKLARAINSR